MKNAGRSILSRKRVTCYFRRQLSFRSALLALTFLLVLASALQWSLFRTFASGTITGTVFRDYNANGVRDTGGTAPNFAIDAGVQSVTVTAYDAAGVSRGTATTAANGTYSLSATGTGPYRIEFTNLPSGYLTGPHGTNNNSSVQFVPDGNSSNINLGIASSLDYVQNDPELVTSCYVFGAQNAAAVATDPVLVTFPYSAGTTDTANVALPAFPTQYDNPTTHALMLPAQTLGTTFGIAYARNSRRIYAAAYFKRHAGFGPGANGTFNNSDDPGAIYRIDRATNTVTATFTVPGATTNAHNTANYQTDNGNTGWDGVGKTSLGGMDMSSDETTLYVMNLQNRTLYALNPTTGAVIASQAVPTSGVPTPGGTATNAAAGDVRPFAVRFYQGSLYVGITTTGESTSSINDLFAHVYSVNPTTLAFSASPVYTVRLNYPRGKANAAAGAVAEWQPWKTVFTNLITDGSNVNRVAYGQPMFTDMVFDNGNLILGIRDRLGDQVGNNTQSHPTSTELFQPRIVSDILRACGNPTSGWTLESDGRCGGTGTATQGTGQGPGSGPNSPPGSGTTGYAEFYHGDSYDLDTGGITGIGSNHDEVVLGTMAQLPGAPDVVSAVWDPIPNVTTPSIETHDGGFRWFNNTSGAFAKSYRLFAGSTTPGADDFFGKAAGLGEVEFISDAAPIEVGNRVWSDTNGNGVQDAGESVISGVTVQLWADTNGDGSVDTQVGTATTDASGNYYFGGLSSTNMLSTPSCSNTITSRVASSSDDAEQSGTTMALTSTSLDLAYTGATVNTTGLRFNNLRIPQGATITSATIQFTTQTVTTANTVNVTVRGENVDNATTFTTAASNLTSRTTTSASVNWSAIAGWGTAGQAGANQLTPNLSSVLQEIVNRGGWVNGNSANFIISNNASTASATRSAQAFDTNSANTALLSVTYQCKYVVNANTQYEVRIATGQAALSSTPALTTANGDSSANGDSRDSDATLTSISGTPTAVVSFLSGANGANDHTFDFGFLTAANAVYSIGNRVFFDTNNNGLMDGAEVGVGNVTVQLLDTSNAVLATQTTATSAGNIGYYRFDNLAAGTYKIRVAASNFTGAGVLVAYQSSTGAFANTDRMDNGADPASNNPSTAGVTSANIVVGNGALPLLEPDVTASGIGAHAAIGDARDNLTVDFGFYKLCLGDFLWRDNNNNGVYNSATESGLANATVKLYQSDGTTEVAVGPDGILGTTDDITGATNRLITAANGLYQFCGLVPGSYVVRVTPPAGFSSSTDVANTGNPNSDTDNDDNGTGTSNGTTSSAINANAIALTPGSEPTVTNTTGTTTNSTLDFGFFSPTAVKLRDFVALQYDAGVLLEWQTGMEVDNLGFNIWREEGGKRTLITPQVVAGTALLSGGANISAGMRYNWWDNSRTKGATYWLEALDLQGASELFGPYYAKSVGGAPPVRSNAAYLSNLGKTTAQDMPLEAKAAMVMAKPSSDRARVQAALATASAALKIGIAQEGFYRLTQADLSRAGFPTPVDPQLLQMFVDGQEVPLSVVGGNAASPAKDGRSESFSAIEFYATGIESAFSTTRTYYLIAGTTPGARIEQSRGEGAESKATSFAYTVERRDRLIYFSGLRNGDKENFFGGVIGRNPLEQTLTALHPDTGSSATLIVCLQGITMAQHNVSVQMNGTNLGAVVYQNQETGKASLRVPQGLLREGVNQVVLTASGGSDISLVDMLQLTYQHTYQADNDCLKFVASGGEQMKLNGFTTAEIRVFDVTNEQQVREVGVKVSRANGGFCATFVAPEQGDRKLLALTATKQKTPASLRLDEASNLKKTDNRADFVIITAKEFAANLEPLRTLRESQGLATMLVNIEDIYDEFSFGQKCPQAIRDFFAYTASWKQAPRYAMFVGDSSFDPKNYMGLGNWDVVPTKLVDTFFLETSSDDWFADFNNDGIGELGIGRLPVRTPDEAKLMVAKLLTYNNTEALRNLLLIADVNDTFDFEEATDTLRGLVGGQMQVTQLKRGQTDPETAKRNLLEQLNRGVGLVNYVGHGSPALWRADLLTNNDALALTNNKRLSVHVMMSCLNGYFHDAFGDSLAESLLKAETGGAVAVWSSTGLTAPSEQSLMNQELYRQLFNGNSPTLGEAMMRAKAITSDTDIRKTWVLLGDPTLRLK